MKREKKVGLKVCGMREPGNVLDVAQLRPDYMGFIWFKGSKRYVGDNFRIPDKLPSSIKRTGVFVNQSTEEILKISVDHVLNFIQLHGDEPVSQCRELGKLGLGIIKVFRIGEQFDFNSVNEYKGHVDYFMFDTMSKDFGGSGRSFSWDILKNYDQEIPFFLSGGISPQNVHEISMLTDMNLHAIDINSGVEMSPGIKDVKMIKEVITELEMI